MLFILVPFIGLQQLDCNMQTHYSMLNQEIEYQKIITQEYNDIFENLQEAVFVYQNNDIKF